MTVIELRKPVWIVPKTRGHGQDQIQMKIVSIRHYASFNTTY